MVVFGNWFKYVYDFQLDKSKMGLDLECLEGAARMSMMKLEADKDSDDD